MRDRTQEKPAVVVTAAALAVVAIACERPKPQPRPEPTATLASAVPTQAVVNAKLGCIPAVRGGHAITGKLSPGFASIAAGRGKALVVRWRALPAPTDVVDPVEDVAAERVLLDGAAKPLGPATPVTDPRATEEAADPQTWAAASTFGGELTTLSYAIARSASAGCSRARVASKGGDQPAKVSAAETCKLASSFAGAGRGDLGIVAFGGLSATDKQQGKKASSVDAVVLSGGASKSLRFEPAPAPTREPDALAAAAGATWAAVAWRTGTAGAEEIHLAGVDKAGVKTTAKAISLDKGHVGGAALAFEGDVLHVVWAARHDDKSPYRLRWAKWDGKGAPPPAQTLSTGAGSAFAPAIAVQSDKGSGRFLVAWTEGDDKAGIVKAGSSRVNILAAVLGADVLSTAGVSARDPAVALDGDTSYVVWREEKDNAEALHATTLRCIE